MGVTWVTLQLFGGHLGVIWRLPGGDLGVIWNTGTSLGKHLRVTWGSLGLTLEDFGITLGSPDGLLWKTLGSHGGYFGALWIHLDALWNHLVVTLGDFGVT